VARRKKLNKIEKYLLQIEIFRKLKGHTQQ